MLVSLLLYVIAYTVVAGGGFVYIFRLIREGPAPSDRAQDGFGPPVRSTAAIRSSRAGRGDSIVREATAPETSLSFLYYGTGLFILPVIMPYTIAVYRIFRGKGRKWGRQYPAALVSWFLE